MAAIRHRIADLFSTHPGTKDDDNLLISLIWEEEVGNSASRNLAILELLRRGELSSPETIRRNRQWLQEHFPGFRGMAWESRHRKAKRFWGFL